MFTIVNAQIVGFSNESGHYCPPPSTLWLCISILKKLGYEDGDIMKMYYKAITADGIAVDSSERVGNIAYFLANHCNSPA